MILKIVAYYIILFGTLFVMRSIVKMMAPMTSASLMFFIYLSSYLILLSLEIRLQLLKKATDKEIKKAAFWFSFWACVGFGILITFYHGYPKFFYSFEETGGVVLGCLLGGIVSGMAGVALSLAIVPFLEWIKSIRSR